MTPTRDEPSVLVVDDDPTNVHALGQILHPDYRVLIATGGEDALQLVEDPSTPQPDLILLDVQMHDIDGYTVCHRLKQNPDTAGIAVIFVTVQASERDEAHGLELGAVDYISKPFNASIVRARVHTHMRLKQQTDLLERYAFLDTLTGTFNRRAFDEHMDRERRRCLRGQRPLSLAMIDVDAFKAFNDGYGHVAGDRCLQRIARALADALHRPGDQLFRYGGEEFAALLPGTDAAGARITAERLRQTVASLAIDHGYYTGRPTVSISVGVDTSRHERLGDHDAVSALVWGADAALYQAKRQGRNQVVAAESIAPPVH